MKPNALVGIVIGGIMMVGGWYLATMPTPPAEWMQHINIGEGVVLEPAKTLSAIGVLLILLPVLNTFFFQPLADAIQGRTAELEKTFSEAANLRSEMTTLKSDYERQLADTQAQAREQIQSQIREAQALRTNLMAEAQNRATDLVKKAQQDIESERQRVLMDLRLHVVNLTLGATEKVLGENVDSDRNRKLVEDFVDKIEVPA